MKKIMLFLLSHLVYMPIKTHEDLSSLIGFSTISSGAVECSIKKVPHQETTYSIVAAYSNNQNIDQTTLTSIINQFHITEKSSYDLNLLKETYQQIINQLPATANESSHELIVACILLSPKQIATAALEPKASTPHVVGHSRPLEYIDQAYFARSTTHRYAQEIEGCITAQETAEAMQLKHETQPFHLLIDIKKWKEFCIEHAASH